MFNQNYEKQESEKQHIKNLTALSGGFPKKGLANKISFYAIFIMNGILYNEVSAHKEAEKLRSYVRESLHDKIQAHNFQFQFLIPNSRTNFSSRNS